MRGQITDHTGDIITVKLFDKLDVETVKKQAINGKYYVNVEVFEKDSITADQRKHLYALFGDISEYTGVPIDHVEAERKYQFMLDEVLPELPSLANNQMKKTEASKFIEFVILYCIENQIPFRKQAFYLTTETNKMLFALTMKRICWITGKRGEIHHASNLVGMGNKRSNHDHEKSTFMCLSREMHNEIHNVGYTEFCKKYHVRAIKLTKENLKELNVI